MKQLVLGAAMLLLAAGSYVLVIRSSDPAVPQNQQLSLSDMEIEIVDTLEARTQGLSGRTEVPAGYGMLFVFDSADRYGFWMKEMLVPIDIIWIKDTGEVVGIDANVAPETFPIVFYAPLPVRYVLEVGAGEAERNGISLGSIITLPGRD